MLRTTGRHIATWRLLLRPGGSDCGLEAQIVAWRLQAGGSDWILEAEIAAWGLRFKLQPGGSNWSLVRRLSRPCPTVPGCGVGSERQDERIMQLLHPVKDLGLPPLKRKKATGLEASILQPRGLPASLA